MKTKLTLFVAVLATAIFLGGCASTETDPITYHKASLINGANGNWLIKDTRQPATGRVQQFIEGKLMEEFYLKNGVVEGFHRKWRRSTTGTGHHQNHTIEQYKNGRLIMRWGYANSNGQLYFVDEFDKTGVLIQRHNGDSMIQFPPPKK